MEHHVQMSTTSFGIKIFLVTKLDDQKNSIVTMDDDKKHSIAKSHYCNFLVITRFFFQFLPKEDFGSTQKFSLQSRVA
jgi:hypothetical protein